MDSRLIISFLVFLLCASIHGANNWEAFEANDIYPKYDTSNCVFPFTYNSVTYNNCTTDGSNGKRPWCSLTKDYVGLFTYCYDFWQSTLTCKFPFTLNSKNFEKCDYISSVAKYKQCRSTNSDYPFRTCIEEHVKKTGKPLLHTDTCNSSYRSMSKYHSMCAGPSDFAIEAPISASDKQDILDTHNYYRGTINAKSMFKLYWDDNLAKLAQVHSNMCAFDHDQSDNRLTLQYKWKNGQNMVMTTSFGDTLSDLLVLMFDEEKDRFDYGKGCIPNPNSATCTHYTQLMLSNMTRVGCAETHCLFPDRVERHLTCNYIHSQYSNNYMIPYQPGVTGGENCPAKRDGDGLCDCGNKICNYDQNEYLDPNTCKCLGGKSKRSYDENDLNKRDVNTNEVIPSKPYAAVPSGNNIESGPMKKRHILSAKPHRHAPKSTK